MPKVTVIIPNYNHERFLHQRMESVLQQTFTDFEVLFLDDASTDGSLEVFQPFAADRRIKVVLNDSNSGSPFKQWNKGLDLARGEFIWIAESDDYANSELLQTLVSLLEAHPDVGLAYCQSWVTKADQAGTPLIKVENWYQDFPDHARWREGFQNDGPSELAKYLVFKNTIPNASAVVFRRNLLADGLRAPEDMRLAGDWMFWVELLLRRNVAFVPEALNYFRIPHENTQRNRMGKHGLHLIEGLDVYSRIVNAIPVTVEIRRAALQHQIKMWGYFAYTQRLALSTNQRIYCKLLDMHPEAVSQRYQQIVLPFIYYFTATPFRRYSIFRVPFRALKRLVVRLTRRPTAEGSIL